MISNNKELKVTMERIRLFQGQVAQLRTSETNPANFHAAASGFMAEIDRMQNEVKAFLSTHPSEVETLP